MDLWSHLGSHSSGNAYWRLLLPVGSGGYFRSVLELQMQILRNGTEFFSSKDRVVRFMAWFQKLQLKQSGNQSPSLSWLEEFRHLLYGYTNIDSCLCLSVESPRLTGLELLSSYHAPRRRLLMSVFFELWSGCEQNGLWM